MKNTETTNRSIGRIGSGRREHPAATAVALLAELGGVVVARCPKRGCEACDRDLARAA